MGLELMSTSTKQTLGAAHGAFRMQNRRIECLTADDHISLQKTNHRRKKSVATGILKDTRTSVIAIGNERIGGSKIYPDDRIIGGGSLDGMGCVVFGVHATSVGGAASTGRLNAS
jgi:hypothetical protein